MQIKATMKHRCLPMKTAKMKRLTAPRVSEGAEHRERSYSTGGDITQHNHVPHKDLSRDVHSSFIHNGQWQVNGSAKCGMVKQEYHSATKRNELIHAATEWISKLFCLVKKKKDMSTLYSSFIWNSRKHELSSNGILEQGRENKTGSFCGWRCSRS